MCFSFCPFVCVKVRSISVSDFSKNPKNLGHEGFRSGPDRGGDGEKGRGQGGAMQEGARDWGGGGSPENRFPKVVGHFSCDNVFK